MCSAPELRGQDGSGTAFGLLSLTPCGLHPGQLEKQREEAQTPPCSPQPHHGWSRLIRGTKSKLHSERTSIGGQGRRKGFQATPRTPTHVQRINPAEERGIPTLNPRMIPALHHSALTEGNGGKPSLCRQHSSHPVQLHPSQNKPGFASPAPASRAPLQQRSLPCASNCPGLARYLRGS